MKTVFVNIKLDKERQEIILSRLQEKAVVYFKGNLSPDELERIIPDVNILVESSPKAEMLQKMKSSKKLSGIPVIFLTSVAQEEDVVKGLEMGANDYVTKPFSFAELYARVKKWVPVRE